MGVYMDTIWKNDQHKPPPSFHSECSFLPIGRDRIGIFRLTCLHEAFLISLGLHSHVCRCKHYKHSSCLANEKYHTQKNNDCKPL